METTKMITALSMAVLFLTGCDVTDVAYTVFANGEAELLCVLESAEMIGESTLNGQSELSREEVNTDEEILVVLKRDGSATIKNSKKTLDAKIYPTMNGIRLSAHVKEALADTHDNQALEKVEMEVSLVYTIDFDLRMASEAYMSFSEESERIRMKITGEGNCKRLDWG